MTTRRILTGAAVAVLAIALSAGPAAADAAVAITADPAPTPPGGSTTMTVELTATSDTNPSLDPTLSVSSSSPDVTLSILTNAPELDPCALAGNVVTCTPPGLFVADGPLDLEVGLAVASGATPSTVTVTAAYTQVSTPTESQARPLQIILPPPTTTTSSTTTVAPTTTTAGGTGGASANRGAGELPRTGATSSTPLLLAGAVMLLAGGAFVAGSYRRTRTERSH